MAGPWEEYAPAPQPASGPWSEYAAAPQAVAPLPQAAPKPQEGFIDSVGSQMRGLRTGLHRIPQSAAELVARGTDAMGVSNGAYPMLHEMFTKDNASYMGDSNNAKVGDVAGQIAGTLPAMALRVPGIAAKLPTMAKVVNGALQGGAAAGMTSSASDAPLISQLALGAGLGASLPLLAAGAKLAGKATVGALGQATGAGGAAVREAFNAGKSGGERGAAFLGNMKGDVPWGQVVSDAKAALGKLKADRSAAYKSGMMDISKDATVLDFKPVNEALESAGGIKTFKGQDLSKSTAEVRKEIADTIENWKKLDPKEYHTPEGFDALKQQLGDILVSQDPSKPSYGVAKSAYDAVKGAIVKQAPTYAKVMDDYSAASDELAALTKELSLGNKGNPNTALRKLQSVLRDNANTSWGDRAKYAGRLEDAGAGNLMPSLAGQALSTPIPRGLTKYADGAALMAAASHNPLLLLGAGAASPRLVGSAAYGAGTATRGATDLARKIPLQLPSFPLAAPLGATSPLLLAPNH